MVNWFLYPDQRSNGFFSPTKDVFFFIFFQIKKPSPEENGLLREVAGNDLLAQGCGGLSLGSQLTTSVGWGHSPKRMAGLVSIYNFYIYI